MNMIDWVEQGWVPDWMTRWGIRRLLTQRLQEERLRGSIKDFAAMLAGSPIALVPERVNEEHYELPAAFFACVLGRHLKYSSCLFSPGVVRLDEAEEAMLALTCQRADIKDGMNILELGCGWGSLSLWLAEHYPACHITAVSNSHSQRKFIEWQCLKRGILNLKIVTQDMNNFDTNESVDRVLSVEMFEHMRNYKTLLAKIARWLTPSGRLFVHIFCHREYAYPFETEGANNWMGRHFFTGGIMPSETLLDMFHEDMVQETRWQVNGTDYQKTAEAWLKNLDNQQEKVLEIFRPVYGAEASLWLMRWRLFFLSCSELFGYNAGREWYVSHTLFRRTV